MNASPADSRVLIVEDAPANIQALTAILREKGYAISIATNGRQALDLLGQADPAPGLILLDLMMPVMSGQEMLAALKQVHALAAIPVTIVSASDDPPPGSSYLHKPVDVEALLGIVEKACGA